MSYYKYVKRDEKSRVDWGAITSNLVDTLKEQEADREKQREAIDASSRATGDVLSDAPQGANKSAGEWILNASSDASQYLMSQNRLLKSGLLDPRDFTVNRQNVENSFKSLQTMAESAHKESQLTQDRINEGKAMNFEGVVGQRLDDFQNFEKTQVYFNPTNGVASIGIKDKDGNLPDDPSQFSTIEGAIAQMQSRYDKFDYTSPLVKWSESIGSDVRVVRKGGVLTIDDPSVQKDVNSSLDDAIAALTVNDLRVLSIAEDLGLVAPDDYNLGATETEWGEKGDKVGVSTANDGTVIPKANDALKEAVKERLKEEGMALLDYKQTARTEFAPQKPTPVEVAAGMLKEEIVGYVEEINTILTDEDSISREALNRRIRTTNEERRANNLSPISEGNITDDSLSITYEDGTTETINLSGNIQKDIVAAYDLLTPKRRGEARPSERELEKYIRDEGLSIGYATDDSGNIIRRVTPLRSSIGVAKIPMTPPDRLLVDSEMVSYDALWKKPLGESLEAIADSNIQVESTFNEILKAAGFMPEEMKRVLEDAGKSYNVKVNGDKMTITIGDTTEEITDVFNDSATGGTAAVVSLMRDTVIKELNRINNLTSGSDETNETSSNTDAASGGNSGGTVRR